VKATRDSHDLATSAEVILVHGAFHGSWCWDDVILLVRAAGIKATAIDLPFTTFLDDVESVRSAIDTATGPVVLCGHSYGGAVITEAGNFSKVQQLVYLCAFAVAEGRSTMDPAEEALPLTGGADGMQLLQDGTIAFDVTRARATFYGDCSDRDVADACSRLRPMAVESLAGRVTRAAWRDHPSLYAVCLDDGAVHPDAQRTMAAQCGETIEWASSHSPFLSMPTVVADLLCDLANRRA
jgi:pimeloyl-ACP methyl ester carboxylesterase